MQRRKKRGSSWQIALRLRDSGLDRENTKIIWCNRDRFAGLPIKRESPNDQHCDNQQQHPDDDEVEDPSRGTLNRSRLYGIEIFCPHYSFRG